jgi:hypothetical protein
VSLPVVGRHTGVRGKCVDQIVDGIFGQALHGTGGLRVDHPRDDIPPRPPVLRPGALPLRLSPCRQVGLGLQSFDESSGRLGQQARLAQAVPPIRGVAQREVQGNDPGTAGQFEPDVCLGIAARLTRGVGDLEEQMAATVVVGQVQEPTDVEPVLGHLDLLSGHRPSTSSSFLSGIKLRASRFPSPRHAPAGRGP